MFHARAKHIAIDYHFMRDKVASKSLGVRFIMSGKDQVADILTKPLVSKKLTLFKSNLNARPPPLRLWRYIRPDQIHTTRDNIEDEDKEDKHQVSIEEHLW